MALDRPGVQTAKASPRSSAEPLPRAPLDRVRSHLRKADPVLARLIDARPTFDPQGWMAELPAMDLFGALLFQIAGQQLSVAATLGTLGRIEVLFGGRLPSPAELLEVSPESLRQAGLSWRKVATLRDLAEQLSDGRLDPDTLSQSLGRRGYRGADDDLRDRPMDRSGRVDPGPPTRRRSPPGRPCTAKGHRAGVRTGPPPKPGRSVGYR